MESHMNQHLDLPVIARFVFDKNRAADFTFGNCQVIEMVFDTVDEAGDYAREFGDALLDVNVLIDGVEVVSLSDFPAADK